jgi:hypothetical protein
MNDAQLSEQQQKVDSGESVQSGVDQVVVVGGTTTKTAADESTQENAANQQQATSSTTTTTKLTVEQQQAEELRMKYPMPQKPGSDFIKKMLNRVNIFFFLFPHK